MMNTLKFVLFTFFLVLSCNVNGQIYDTIALKTIDGENITLQNFRGKKVLIVNTASKCGYTKQFSELQKLHELEGDELVILGFPTDNFMNQEFSSEVEIKEFCQKNYGVTFQMMEKVNVKGKNIHPFFEALLNEKTNGYGVITIKWNFHKILLDEKHFVLKDFSSSVDPMSPEIFQYLK